MNFHSQNPSTDPIAKQKGEQNAASHDTFEALGLCHALCKAVENAGYTAPTPIQSASIAPIVNGRDLLGCAQTGSGKTAAFALPILQNLMHARKEASSGHAVRALVLAPTRELASQIGDCFAKYSQGSGLRHLVVFGGVNKNPQIRALRQPPEILVACPGRLLDLVQNEGLSLDRVEMVVLDEADRMLDMGFVHDVRRVFAKLPRKRQTLMFSATMPKEIEALAGQLLASPQRVAVDPVSSTAGPIAQSVFFVPSKQKQALLQHLLTDQSITRALVFTRTKHGANRVAQRLERVGITAAAIHGNKSQGARERALNGFRDGSIRTIVATDLASRGIDVKELSHVINFELPNISETYVHRVGRTGRAGASGVAISLCDDEERSYLRNIERLTGTKLVRKSLDGIVLPQVAKVEEREARQGGSNRRSPGRQGGRGGRGNQVREARSSGSEHQRQNRRPRHGEQGAQTAEQGRQSSRRSPGNRVPAVSHARGFTMDQRSPASSTPRRETKRSADGANADRQRKPHAPQTRASKHGTSELQGIAPRKAVSAPPRRRRIVR